jgi:hypothetical protein
VQEETEKPRNLPLKAKAPSPRNQEETETTLTKSHASQLAIEIANENASVIELKVIVEESQSEMTEILEEIETERIEIGLLEMKKEVKRVKSDEASYVRPQI